MKKEKEIRERIKFLEELLEKGNMEGIIMGSMRRRKLVIRIEILKWVIDEI